MSKKNLIKQRILGDLLGRLHSREIVVYMTSKFCNGSVSVSSFSAIDHPTIIAFSFAIKRWLVCKHFWSCEAKAK